MDRNKRYGTTSPVKCKNYTDLMTRAEVTEIEFSCGYITQSKYERVMDYLGALYIEKHSDLMAVRNGQEAKDKRFFQGVGAY